MRSGQSSWLVLDGAHTAASGQALAATLRRAFPDNPLAFVVAMADDKDHEGMATALHAAGPDVIVFTSVPIAGSMARCNSSHALACFASVMCPAERGVCLTGSQVGIAGNPGGALADS